MERAVSGYGPYARGTPRFRAAAPAAAVLLLLGCLFAAACLSSAGTNGFQADEGASLSPSFAELLATPASSELPGQLVIYFLDVGQADACVIRTPGGGIVVIDAGRSAQPLVGFLEAKGVERIDLLVLSHPHADHIGGALAILESFEVGTLCDSGFEHTTTLYEEVLARSLELVNAGAMVYVSGRAGVVLDADPAITMTVLHPSEPIGNDANEASVVVRLVFDSFAALFTGDIGLVTEEALLAGGAELSAQVLKVAHHGSARSSGEAFLRAVGPDVAVIQVGLGNPYNHPAQAALDRLAAVGAEVYTTAREGTVVVHTGGLQWAVLVGP